METGDAGREWRCGYLRRSCEGSDRSGVEFLLPYRISIHAPVKGATHCSRVLIPVLFYFNPRSREGSDPHGRHCTAPAEHFNPCSREGSDITTAIRKTTAVISIHAPAKGATSIGLWVSLSIFNFNPRSREGSDAHTLAGFGGAAISIHAPAKGATPAAPRRPPGRVHFNPRSREGSDFAGCTNTFYDLYFNPRSREGSDKKTGELVQGTKIISIHAPAKGATLKMVVDPVAVIFQSTLP